MVKGFLIGYLVGTFATVVIFLNPVRLENMELKRLIRKLEGGEGEGMGYEDGEEEDDQSSEDV